MSTPIPHEAVTALHVAEKLARFSGDNWAVKDGSTDEAAILCFPPAGIELLMSRGENCWRAVVAVQGRAPDKQCEAFYLPTAVGQALAQRAALAGGVGLMLRNRGDRAPPPEAGPLFMVYGALTLVFGTTHRSARVLVEEHVVQGAPKP